MMVISTSSIEATDDPPTSANNVTDIEKYDRQESSERGDLSDNDSQDDQHLLTENAPSQARKISEKKRKDVAGFHTWLTESQRTTNNDKPFQQPSTVDRLLEYETTPKIIESPREYQLELFERAKQKNIIVVLDTGSGKTLIAVLLLHHMLDEEIERRVKEGEGCVRKTAFFIVEKVALCVQQHRVLRHNLDHPIGIIHGDSGMTNSKDFWQGQTDMAIVITSQTLYDALSNGFINMRQISLLIFDEAHHTKKNHPYAKIIKSHYLREPDPLKRPKILGMTASPVDAQTRDMRAAAAELESMMCSEIATVSDDTLADMQNRRAVETQETFDRLPPKEQSRTPLWEQINALTSDNDFLRVALDFTEEASSVIGPWGADRFWSLIMTDLEVTKLIAKTEGDIGDYALSGDVKNINQRVAAIHSVHQLAKDHALQQEVSGPAPEQLSAKFKLLLTILREQFERGTSRCIVFVEKRYMARLLSDLLQRDTVRIPGVLAAYMVGAQVGSAKSAVVKMSFKEQVETLWDFKEGNVNCLFTTTVAEEGIDIPACDLVIRWDMYSTMIQYIQSRGRARREGSRFISLIENGNSIHARLYKQAPRDSNALRRFCSSLPEDRKVQDLIDATMVARAEEAGQKSLEIESTGARLTYQNCFETLERFVSSLLGPSDTNFNPEFGVMPGGVGKSFTAHVILPAVAPITYVSGHPQRSKQMARRSAAYEACVQLYEKKYIDDNLQSTLVRRLPAMRNARLAISSAKKAEYSMRVKPEIWSKTGPVETLFAAFVTLANPSAVGRSSSPIALLTRQPLPALPDIPLYFGAGSGQSTLAKLLLSEQSIGIAPKLLQNLCGFTLKVFNDVFSKQYEANVSTMPYFLAPILRDTELPFPSRIDWMTVNNCQVDTFLNWEDQPVDFYRDKLVIDPYDGSRKFITHGVNPELKPSDPPPADAPLPKARAYRLMKPSIKEYSNSYYQKRRMEMADQWKEDQPVVDAELLSLRRNFLDEFVDEATSNRCSIILQPLKISPIPIGVVTVANLFPAIIHRIDQTLIALEACTLLSLKIQPSLALEACTKDSDNSDEHDQRQINFQQGMGANYERLEFLGDSFLKMATTISLFTVMPSMKEFEAHTARMVLIANQNLFNHAVDRKLQEYVRSQSFDRRSWYPDLPLKKGKAPKAKEPRHSLGDKTVADVCEALIGAAYLSHRGNMDMAVRAVTKMVRSANHKMKSWKDYYAAFKIPDWMDGSGGIPQAQRVAVAAVSDKIGYTFRLPALLRSAFKHPSYTWEPSIPDYQRLEFLGDALLDMVVVDHLFRTFPGADPQWLTEHKMAIVSNQFLGCLCVKLGLHSHILLATSTMMNQRAGFASDLEHAEATAREAAGSGPVRGDFWRSTPSSSPKALADVVEALIGAIFVDSHYSYPVVETFFNVHILPYFEDMTLYDSFGDKHPVTALTKRLHDLGCRDWRLLLGEVPASQGEGVKQVTETEVVCALLVHGKVFADAGAKSGRHAKVACAKRARRRLEEMRRVEFRGVSGCDCEGDGEEKEEGNAGVAI